VKGYADLIKLALLVALAGGFALWGRSCGRADGLQEGAAARQQLADGLAKVSQELAACDAGVRMANDIADQAAAEAERHRALAEQAAQRATQAQKEADRRIANMQRQLEEARQNPEAAAQLDIELHPSIPLL